MKAYLDLLNHVLENGKERGDRTGTGTIGVFGAQARFDLRESFPCLTTKKLHLRSIIHELLWFLQGDTNIKYLKDNGVRIRDPGEQSIRLRESWIQFETIPTAGATSSVPGIRRMLKTWRYRPATRCSSFMSTKAPVN